jgi:hypothetical protein
MPEIGCHCFFTTEYREMNRPGHAYFQPIVSKAAEVGAGEPAVLASCPSQPDLHRLFILQCSVRVDLSQEAK